MTDLAKAIAAIETPLTDALEETLTFSQLSYANRAGDAIAFARSLERERAYALGLTPVPAKRSWMSRRRHTLRFSKYSLSPVR